MHIKMVGYKNDGGKMKIFYVKMVVAFLGLAYVGSRVYAFCSPEYIASKRGTYQMPQEEKKPVVQSAPKRNNWITFEQMEAIREAKWEARRRKEKEKALEEQAAPIY